MSVHTCSSSSFWPLTSYIYLFFTSLSAHPCFTLDDFSGKKCWKVFNNSCTEWKPLFLWDFQAKDKNPILWSFQSFKIGGVSFLHFSFRLKEKKLEWGIKRERKKKGNKIGTSNGVRRGVWHSLSCLLKASFFPLLPPPFSADHRYVQRLHSAAAYLAVLLKGSQKLKLWALVSLSRVF